MAFRTRYDWWDGHYHDTYPTRYRLPDFRFSKSLRRVLNGNQNLKTVISTLRITTQKEEMYYRHCSKRFNEPPRQPLHQRYDYIVHNASRLTELCVFHPDEGLIAFSIFEIGEYSTYGNIGASSLKHPKRSLGTFTLLKEIEHAISLGHFYYYLGHVYLANPVYHYKTRFPASNPRTRHRRLAPLPVRTHHRPTNPRPPQKKPGGQRLTIDR